jgi:hypothetical protein
VGTGYGDPEVPKLPSVRGYSWATPSLEDINTKAWSSRLGLDMRLTTSPCKKKFVENILSGNAGILLSQLLKCKRIAGIPKARWIYAVDNDMRKAGIRN